MVCSHGGISFAICSMVWTALFTACCISSSPGLRTMEGMARTISATKRGTRAASLSCAPLVYLLEAVCRRRLMVSKDSRVPENWMEMKVAIFWVLFLPFLSSLHHIWKKQKNKKTDIQLLLLSFPKHCPLIVIAISLMISFHYIFEDSSLIVLWITFFFFL